ncbi:hypothetical protein [Candidatus Parabeggiatoa sp. HSG14]|uniref:hypothetical protein n=1 Tax=Candidatus Parabeggiatoa sp. HSG14 TaxID=3055593 RepID=UPI0025A724C5|nr:hypothetical protein [Thiotrichales bacterium HSG14]
MQEQTAIHYGQVELIPGIICDGYVLNDGATVMSVLGTAKLLSMYHGALQNYATKGIPKALKPFINKDFNSATKTVLVVAKNSNHNGKKISIYDSSLIESLIQAYAFALASNTLRETQKHIGERCVFLMGALVKTALEAAIKQACGLSPNIQQTVQQNYVELIKEFGFSCSFDNEIATKKDIVSFLNVPESTLNSGLAPKLNPHSLIMFNP